MAFVHGKGTDFSVDGNNISTYTDSVSLDRNIDTAETTAFGDDDRTYIAGLRGHTFTASGHWDSTLDGYAIGMDDGAVVAFEYGPEGSTAGDVKYSGNALITNYSQSSGVGDKASWSASFQVTGSVTRGTYA